MINSTGWQAIALSHPVNSKSVRIRTRWVGDDFQQWLAEAVAALQFKRAIHYVVRDGEYRFTRAAAQRIYMHCIDKKRPMKSW